MMSDVTNVRRAEEALAEHRSPDPIDRATVHASLAISRAVRELDTTTRQVNRLVADSIDELAADLSASLRALIPAAFEQIGEAYINPAHVTAVFPGATEGDVQVTAGASTYTVSDTTPAEVVRKLGGI